MGEISVVLTLSLLYGSILDPKTGKDKEGHHWGYEGETGPNHWVNHFPRCGGERQSPVNIIPGEVEYASWLTPLQFEGYDRYMGHRINQPITVKNNGHTASMAVTDNLTLRGAHLNGDYKLAEMHLHWGSNNTIGSEHCISGKKKPAEIHFVHFAERYGNLSEAMKMPDGLAVVGVFVDIVPHDNHAIGRLCTAVDSILEYGTKANLTTIRMMDFLPMNTNLFYHYRGSLTTPPCYESVLWFVMENTIQMSARQLDTFRYLQEKVEEHVGATGTANSHSSRVFKAEPIYIQDNFRPLQPLNNRKVYSNRLTLDRPRLSHFELPSVQRTPLNKHSIQNLNGHAQTNSIQHPEPARTDYIYNGLSHNSYQHPPRYDSPATGVISNGNNLLIGSIPSRDLKDSLRQHLQPDYMHNSKPVNEINRGPVFSPSHNERLHVFKAPDTASVLSNRLNSGRAAPLLDFIFTQMNGLTRTNQNERNFNSHDYTGTVNPKDRIFGGLSDTLTKSQVLSHPYLDNSFGQLNFNRGNIPTSTYSIFQGQKHQNTHETFANGNLMKIDNNQMQGNMHGTIDGLSGNNAQRNVKTFPYPASRHSPLQTGFQSRDVMAPLTAMYANMDSLQASVSNTGEWPYLKTYPQRCQKLLSRGSDYTKLIETLDCIENQQHQPESPENVKLFNCDGQQCDFVEYSFYNFFLEHSMLINNNDYFVNRI